MLQLLITSIITPVSRLGSHGPRTIATFEINLYVTITAIFRCGSCCLLHSSRGVKPQNTLLTHKFSYRMKYKKKITFKMAVHIKFIANTFGANYKNFYFCQCDSSIVFWIFIVILTKTIII